MKLAGSVQWGRARSARLVHRGRRMIVAIGWAVVGTGAHVVGRMAPAMARAKESRLAAVFSRELPRAQEVAGKFGFAHAYDSYDALLKESAVDAVYICTPNALHAEQTIQAARA